jgi:hypothetical protein
MDRRNFLNFGAALAQTVIASTAAAQVFTPESVDRPARRLPAIRPLQVRPKASGNAFEDMPRGSFGCVKVDDEVFVLGGHTGHAHCYPAEVFSDQFLAYNTLTRNWRALRNYPFAVQSPNLVRVAGSVFSFGGYRYDDAFRFAGCKVTQTPQGEVTEQENDTYSARSDDRVMRYDVKSDTWELVAYMPRRRSSGTAYSFNGKIYLIGGWDGTPQQRRDKQGHFHASVEVFDPATNMFQPLDSTLSLPLRRALAGTEMNGKFLLVGGLTETGRFLQNVTAFDAGSGRCSEVALLPGGRFAPGACFTGKWLVVAGGLNFDPSPIVMLYDFGSRTWFENRIQLDEPTMFVELVPLGADRVLALGGFPATDYMPKAMVKEIALSPGNPV